jgi:glycosyltransferase involved in cell wall biosynthesis
VRVPPGDPEALAAALTALLSDAPRRAALGAAGRAWVLAQATPDAVAAAFEPLVERALAHRQARP